MDNRILIEMTSIQTVDGQADTNRLTYHGRYQETDGNQPNNKVSCKKRCS